jgi:RNA polymerase sigma factor (sigma-70 family)
MVCQELTDGQLLTEFIKAHDESAFAEIVRRHSAMVLNVCRRKLNNAQDAEDASQAVFLALARKAAKLQTSASIAPWLHHVACCVAINLRKSHAARARHQEQVAAMSHRDELDVGQRERVRSELDDQLDTLPEKHRRAVVLFHLEGLTLTQTAAALGCPEATAGTWLSRGRETLAQKLSQRGVVVSVGLLISLLSTEAEGPGLPAGYATATAKAATSFASQTVGNVALASHTKGLAEGVLKSMSYLKLKVAVITAVLLLGTGASVTAYTVFGEEASQQPAQASARKEKPAAKQDSDQLFDQAKLAKADVVIRGVCSEIKSDSKSKAGWPQFHLTIANIFKPKESTTLFPGHDVTLIALKVQDREATYYLVKADQYPEGYYRLVDGQDLNASSSHVGAVTDAVSMYGTIHVGETKDKKGREISFKSREGAEFVVTSAESVNFEKLDGKTVILNAKVDSGNDPAGRKMLNEVKLLKTFEPAADGTMLDGGGDASKERPITK